MSVPSISPVELKAILSLPAEEQPVLLDVRTEKEHHLVALPGAKLLPVQELQARVGELSSLKNKEVITYCHHGVRSQNAAAFLIAQGFRVRSLTGGIDLYAQQVDPSLPRY